MPLLLLLAVAVAEAHPAAWTAMSAMPDARSDFTATVVGADAIVVVGGCDAAQQDGGDYSFCPSVSAAVAKYSPDGDEWTSLAAAPRPRYRHAAALHDGKVYVIGGRDVDDGLVAAVDVYDVARDAWSTAPSFEVARSDLGAVVHNGVLLVAGGYDAAYTALATTRKIDLNDFSEVAGPTLNVPRGDFALVKTRDTAYAVGGWTHHDWCQPLASTESVGLEVLGTRGVDEATTNWAPSPNLAVARGDKASAATESAVYVIGGEHNNGCATGSVPVDDVEVLDEADAGRWAVVGSIPEDRFRVAAAALGGALFVFGGQAPAVETCATGTCWPVTSHVWKIDLEDLAEDDGGDDDDDDRYDTANPAFVAVVVIVVALVLVLAAVTANHFRGTAKSAPEDEAPIKGGDLEVPPASSSV